MQLPWRKRGKRALSAAEFQRQRPASARWRLLRVALLWIAVVALCSYFDWREVRGRSRGSGFTYIEQYAYNARMQAAMRRNSELLDWARQQIVLVAISDNTFSDSNAEKLHGPPVPRRDHARVLRDLMRAGAKLVVFDLIFKQPTSPADDRALAAAAQQARGRVLWACLIENEENDPTLVQPIAPLLKASPHYGHILVPQESERLVVKHLSSVEVKGNYVVPSLSLQAVRMALGLGGQRLRRVGGGWQVGDFAVPDELPITYLGRPDEQTLNPVAYEQLVNGAVDDPFYKENHFFKNKIIVIGDTTTVGNDHRNTPVGYMAGAEIQAHAIASLLMAARLHRPMLRDAPPWANFLVMCLLTALACRFAASWRLLNAFAGVLLTLAAYGFINVALFTDYGIDFHLFAPTLAVVLVTLCVLTERALTEEREKNWMRHLLRRYVSPQIVEYVISHPERCILGGEQITATVLFSDIRGFTKMAQQLPPQRTVALLNEYFQEMTRIVFKHDGTLDKFIGDGIMAFYGAPVPHDDHARRAVATAIDMQEALLAMQARWQAQGLPPLEIGIGINTGDMVFGHMGAEEQMNFSVIGDAVNFAARLEKLNKELHTRILISESTYAFVKDEVKAHGPLVAHVPGVEDAVAVYEIYGWRRPRLPAAIPAETPVIEAASF